MNSHELEKESLFQAKLLKGTGIAAENVCLAQLLLNRRRRESHRDVFWATIKMLQKWNGQRGQMAPSHFKHFALTNYL